MHSFDPAGELPALPIEAQPDDHVRPSHPSYVINEEDENDVDEESKDYTTSSEEESEELDQCMSLPVDGIGEEESIVVDIPVEEAVKESLDEEVKSPVKNTSTDKLHKILPIRNSLEQFRIKKIESSDEDDSDNDYPEVNGANIGQEARVTIDDYKTGTYGNGSFANQIPDIVLLDEVKSRQAHSRQPSKDLRLTKISNQSMEFSRTLIEQV